MLVSSAVSEFIDSGYQIVVPRPTTSASSGNLEKMQIIRSVPLKWGTAKCILTSPTGESDAQEGLRTFRIPQMPLVNFM